jgi:hypothetical protein
MSATYSGSLALVGANALHRAQHKNFKATEATLGVTTSFFSATQEELEAAAPGWVRPRYGTFSVKEVLNPFTRTKTLVKQHELLSEEPHDCPPDEIHKLVKRERAFAWKLAGPELEDLMRLMTNAPDDKVAELARRALLGPEDAENWVFQFPDVFVEALAHLSSTEVPRVARAWQEKLGWPEAPTAILEQLVEVASEAATAQRRMFSYVSL